MHKKQFIHKKPAYYRGQLLNEEDFRDEQRYHANARYRHNLNLHGWGIVHGLEVRHAGGNEIVVSPGFAVDGLGHEIDLRHEEKLQLPSNEANAVLVVSLHYEEDDVASAGDDDAERNTRKCYGVVTVEPGAVEAAVILATIVLDDKSHVSAQAIKTTNRRHMKTLLAPCSVTADSLDAHLKRGWLRMPFRPTPLPAENAVAPPPFRVGPTEARAHREIDEKPNDKGAAGTMAISLAPSVTRVLRLRVAGEINDARLSVELFLGGWDADARKHVAKSLLKQEIKSGPYDETWHIKEGDLHLETSTLSIEIRSEAYVRVSLVAIEVTCDPSLLHVATVEG
ncbi:hypothetical protein LJ655_00920 [Paraburkholderia sp. MMS20-SJTN17]|uniref:Uncharacterized protein n=1 Tax=Paraburkholderia translucens TaxID=2886945 RepID=A0ABS8K6U5_9BURK|nr:hypothetical protein [Paraburkholderia sp. MMS20-SJTN17]MCC8400465.1 hypothetical protein [Paraburkholderia sp. MMS20-SJTN17]